MTSMIWSTEKFEVPCCNTAAHRLYKNFCEIIQKDGSMDFLLRMLKKKISIHFSEEWEIGWKEFISCRLRPAKVTSSWEEKTKQQNQQHCVYSMLKEKPPNSQTTQILQLMWVLAAPYYTKLHISEFSVAWAAFDSDFSAVCLCDHVQERSVLWCCHTKLWSREKVAVCVNFVCPSQV